MSALLLALLLGGAPVKAAPADAPKAGVTLKGLGALKQLGPNREHVKGTKCGACHATASWTEVRFNHDRTGFPLTGGHAATLCKSCHQVDFETALPRVCAGCHRDVHAGDLGSRCEGCHDAFNWSSRIDVAAHRRSVFPLLGAHAALPCVECHLETRERRFSRGMVDCTGCHAVDAQRTVGTSLDHVSLGFTLMPCRNCHGAFRFRPARFPGHDACFPVTVGPHAGISCETCHTTLAVTSVPGTCQTLTAACTNCHEHACSIGGAASETDARHAQVPGYQCADRKCWECHQPGTGGTP